MGASSGIGRELARLFIGAGATVGLAARRTAPLEELRAAAPGRVFTERIDICADDAPQALLRLAERMGGMELYFHAAGVGHQNPDLEADTELATLQTNGTGFARMAGAAFRYFATHGGGHIAAITSIAGTRGLGPAPAYSATKAFQSVYLDALDQLSRSRRLGIRFTDIHPGFVRTPLLAGGGRYPMLMEAEPVARSIFRAVGRGRRVLVIDWRYRLLVTLWRLVPRWLWRRINLLHATR